MALQRLVVLLALTAVLHFLQATAQAQTVPAPGNLPAEPSPAQVPIVEPETVARTVPLAVGQRQENSPIGPIVVLTADSTDARLEMSNGRWWTIVCEAPCERRQDPSLLYRVGGRGLLPSGSFVLPTNNERVVVTANTASHQSRTAAWVVVLTGAAVAGIGVGLFALSANAPSDVSGEQKAQNDSYSGLIPVTVIGGGALALAGLIGLLFAKTSVQVH